MLSIKSILRRGMVIGPFLVLPILFTAGCSDSAAPGDPSVHADNTQMVKGVSEARDLFNKLQGSWKSERGDSLVFKDGFLREQLLLPDGTPSGLSANYKLIGPEKGLPNAIRIDTSEGQLTPAVVIFRDDNTMLYGYTGDNLVVMKRE